MLAYHPSFDANHCAYRLLHILHNAAVEEFDWEILRIADFYYVFPHLLKAIKPMPKNLLKGKKSFNEIPDPYESVPNPKRLLFDLRDIQNSAIIFLISKQIVDKEFFENGVVRINRNNIPDSLIDSFSDNPTTNESWFKVLSKEINSVEMNGKTGFKSRTGLMEYRYD